MGRVGRDPGCVGRDLGRVGRVPGCVGRDPGCVGRDPGCVGRDPGAQQTADSVLQRPAGPLPHSLFSLALSLSPALSRRRLLLHFAPLSLASFLSSSLALAISFRSLAREERENEKPRFLSFEQGVTCFCSFLLRDECVPGDGSVHEGVEDGGGRELRGRRRVGHPPCRHLEHLHPHHLL
eukprot:1046702-Rhodomonas_salina.1